MNGYVVVKGKGGLGNRMLSAMTGILYSLLSERRIVIDWSDFSYSNDGSNVFPRLFCVPNSDGALPQEASSSVRPSLWRERLQMSASAVIQELDPAAHTSFRGFRKFSFDFSKLDYDEVTLIMWSYTQHIAELRPNCKGEFGWIMQRSDEDVMRWLLRDHLCLQPSIMNDIKDKWRRLAQGQNIIGAHVRYSDRRTDLAKFTRILDELMSRGEDAKIFLATDNIGVQSALAARYGTVITNDKWFPEEGKIMHQSSDCPDRFQNAIDALTDMYMLSMCKYLVFSSRSTFSYVSSLLSDIPRNNLFDIDRTWMNFAKRYIKRTLMSNTLRLRRA